MVDARDDPREDDRPTADLKTWAFGDFPPATSLAVGAEGCEDLLSLMKILVVEDQRRLGLFLKKNLSQHGYTTTWVQTCEAAGDAICENRYDVIILDLGLPDGSGLQLLRE